MGKDLHIDSICGAGFTYCITLWEKEALKRSQFNVSILMSVFITNPSCFTMVYDEHHRFFDKS